MEDEDFRLLEFELAHPRNDQGKALALAEEFGLSPIEFFQLLVPLIDEPEVISTYPAVRRRLIRTRSRLHLMRKPSE